MDETSLQKSKLIKKQFIFFDNISLKLENYQ